MNYLKANLLNLAIFALSSSCHLNPFIESFSETGDTLLLEASVCQLSLVKKDFYLSEIISFTVYTNKVFNLTYNLNDSEWLPIPANAIEVDQIRIPAAQLGVGAFQLRLRAQDNQQAQMDCQGSVNFQIHAGVIPTPARLPNNPLLTPDPVIQSPTNLFVDLNGEYQPVVGPSNKATSFKEANNPFRTVDDSSKSYFIMQEGGYPNTLAIRYRVDGTTNSKLKFFFPPGTISFSGSFLLANFPPEYPALPAIGIMRMHSFPTTPLSQITLEKAFSVDNSGGFGGEFGEKILINLFTPQKEVYFYGLPRGGGLSISFGGYALSPLPRVAGWVYGHFQYPTGRAATGNFSLSVDKDCYINWYNNANWDSDGNPKEGVEHKCTNSSSR